MSTELTALGEAQESKLRLPIGLLVKTGDLVPTRDGRSERPTQLDHFRFTAGALDQYSEAAERAVEVYGNEPVELDDVLLLSNSIGEVLDIRIKAWGKSGPKIIGLTNFAMLSESEYRERVEAWDDEILYFPREASEVPARMRDAWQGEPIQSKLAGPDDKRIGQFEMRVEATLRFGLPRILGLGKVALYTTTSKHNRENLYKALWFAHDAFRGNVMGIHFRLGLRPRKTSYFDKEQRGYRPTQTYEVVLDTPWTLQEAIDAIKGQREALGQPPERLALPSSEFFAGTEERERVEEESRLIGLSRGLPQPVEEDTRVREEPAAVERPDEAQLNRLANLAAAYEGEVTTYLIGAFNAGSFGELTAAQAGQAEIALARLVDSQAERVDGEVVPEADPFAGIETQHDPGRAGEEPVSFEDLVPESVKKRRGT